jgi:Recombinase/Recombinase zinc beta ribbon domain
MEAMKARAEWEKTSQRYKRMQRQLRENNYLTGRRSYGHQIVESGGHKTLEPDPEESDVIRWAVERYLTDDWSLARICRHLHADGKPAPNPKGWNPQTLARIFHNPVIAGRRKAFRDDGKRGKTVLRVPPIIDSVTFDRLQAKMESRAHRSGVASADAAVLTSVLFCGQCKGPMYRLKTTARGKAYLYYRCHGNERNPSTCKLMVPLDAVEREVATLVWKLWGNEPYKEIEIIPGTNHDDEINEIKRDMRDLDPEDEDYLAEVTGMKAEIERLRNLPRKPDEIKEYIVPGITRADVWMGASEAEQRRALIRWGVKLYVYRTGPRAFEIKGNSTRVPPPEATLHIWLFV